ncbi:ACP phosphodiesterase [Agarivorans sp. Alg241-V36]|uniref:acyl carrier protein phosphodiesterase n=1 Tax=Agarivorans sp. Alg241-V36 TaxID=2305992 RepID=UPI0013D47EA1|nr:ACP phosphodiesterase [Agarivorans sp. Alg241-V36]
MNYLAHFHIAQHTNTSVVGAFLGDFVKGNHWQSYHDEVQLGIKLHRKIDSFTDQQVNQLGLTHYFQADLRRYSGIALDVYFDYLLSLHWQQFSQSSRSNFISHCYQQLQHFPLPDKAMHTANHMREYDWLEQYQHQDSVAGTLRAISRRLRRPVKLELLYEDILCHSNELEAAFLALYPKVLLHAQEFLSNYPPSK